MDEFSSNTIWLMTRKPDLSDKILDELSRRVKLMISFRLVENSDFSTNRFWFGSKSNIFVLDAIFEFWQNIWKRSQKSVVIIQLDPTDSNYFKEQELKNEMTLK